MPEQATWLRRCAEPGVIVAGLALLFTIFQGCKTSKSLDAVKGDLGHQIKATQDSIRQLAVMQSEPIREAIEHDLDSKVVAPKAVIEKEQQNIKQLALLAPNSTQVWKAVGALASYKSVAYKINSFPPDREEPCLPLPNIAGSSPLHSKPAEGDVQIPRDVMVAVNSMGDKIRVFSACIVDLDTIKSSPNDVLFFPYATIIYHGGPLPAAARIVFFECTFHFEPNTIPNNEGRNLLLAALNLVPGDILTVNGSSD